MIKDTSDNLIQEVFSTSPGDPPMQTGPNDRSFDLTALAQSLAGQRIRISFEQEDNLFFFNASLDDVSFITELYMEVKYVEVDIRPGGDTDPINLKSKGSIPVAILSTNTAAGEPVDFDANTIDATTVEFAGAGPIYEGGHLEDVDRDGDMDWVGHFKAQETDIDNTDTRAIITGKTIDGEDFIGWDTINIVGGPKKAPLRYKRLTTTWGTIKRQ